MKFANQLTIGAVLMVCALAPASLAVSKSGKAPIPVPARSNVSKPFDERVQAAPGTCGGSAQAPCANDLSNQQIMYAIPFKPTTVYRLTPQEIKRGYYLRDGWTAPSDNPFGKVTVSPDRRSLTYTISRVSDSNNYVGGKVCNQTGCALVVVYVEPDRDFCTIRITDALTKQAFEQQDPVVFRGTPATDYVCAEPGLFPYVVKGEGGDDVFHSSVTGALVDGGPGSDFIDVDEESIVVPSAGSDSIGVLARIYDGPKLDLSAITFSQLWDLFTPVPTP